SGKSYYVALPRSDGLSWALYPEEPDGTGRAYGGPSWTVMYGCYRFRLNPGGEPTVVGEVASITTGPIRLDPENVINGWNRAVEGKPNSWAPDPKQALPQWIELAFRQPVRFNTVHVAFQLAAMAAPAYKIESSTGGKDWKVAVSVNDNDKRRRVHSFDPVTADRLRLVLEKPCADGTPPRVCEIRVYDEPTP
ncbi:discoidin domain-containing protein, partial [Candidatus Sumerlaeota bacterium]|nr:discoidin domain-containing protein [Candidatus Sumerlaeota bacterium]